ncbi:MAG: hypothetical protein JO089_03360, partial [Alphaproteobacteria bacterium]|nr:hypothetical protein [Alphaproteobacteria bacterium]
MSVSPFSFDAAVLTGDLPPDSQWALPILRNSLRMPQIRKEFEEQVKSFYRKTVKNTLEASDHPPHALRPSNDAVNNRLRENLFTEENQALYRDFMATHGADIRKTI